MNDLAVFVLAIAAIWIAILAFYRRLSLSKRGFTLSFGTLMWRTKKGLGFIDGLARRFRRGWILYGTVAAVLGFVLMFGVFSSIVLNTLAVLTHPREAVPGITFILPGALPGLTVTVWLVAVGVVLIVHEFSHGILLRSQGMRTKSVGLLLFFFIPGAFVEPDEREVRRSSPGKRMRMFAAGPVMNVLISILFFLALLAFVVPRPGVYIVGVAENTPLAENAQRILGARILFLDNWEVKSLENVSRFKENLLAENRREFYVVTDRENFRAEIIRRGEDNYLPFLSARALSRLELLNPLTIALLAYGTIFAGSVFDPHLYRLTAPASAVNLLQWLFALNFGIGLFNLLPAKPLDGGYMLEALLEKRFSRKAAGGIVKALSLAVLFLIIMNLIPIVVRW